FCAPVFFFSSRRRHTRFSRDWSSDVCSSDLGGRSGTAGWKTACCPSPRRRAFPLSSLPRHSRLSGPRSPGSDRHPAWTAAPRWRSEEHTSELQSRENLVCRLLLEKKKHEKTW